MSSKDLDKDNIDNVDKKSENETTKKNADPQVVTGSKFAQKISDDAPLNLTKMYQDWFLDYASYVILERAVPHLNDGLKPVQRRILHSMKRMDDGRYNKVANIIGNTMQFHPHGDASIGDAL
ncbi:MAG: DNA gyrase subunit A, partial [Dysgonamonadaceae bacterium]|nr:DNA gyrase subunit A [Dysgonamonadaceae bacterium]